MTATQVKWLYWTCTVLFAAMITFSGVMTFVAGDQVMQAMSHLGYPMYFAKMLGVAKILGAVVLVANRPTRMKEWAYAGFTFDLIAATFSNWMTGSPMMDTCAPVVFMVVLFGSYFTWHRRENACHDQGMQTRRAA